MFKNKYEFVTFLESIFTSLWTFQLTHPYTYIYIPVHREHMPKCNRVEFIRT